jgi:NAD(P)H-flavin reductase
MRGPKAPALERSLPDLARRARSGVPTSSSGASTARLLATSDPELESLLGLIRRRRSQQLARQSGLLAATPNGSPRPEPGTLLELRDVGPSVRIFRIARPLDFTFEAGQSIKLGLDGASVRRRYSIASAPHEEHLEFCIEQSPGGRFTSQLFELSPGDRVWLASKPKGELALRADRRQHVMVATVTGIAPLRSLLRDALHCAAGPSGRSEPAHEFWILHGASHMSELPYADELAALGRDNRRVHYVPTISRPDAPENIGWEGHHGRVETLLEPTLRALRSKADVAVYACGHPEMVRGVRERLTPLGYPVLDEAFA